MSKKKTPPPPPPKLEGAMVDTHAHLEMKPLSDDLEGVLKRARNGGVTTILTVASDLPSNYRALEISKNHDGVYASAGVHPHNASEVEAGMIEELRKLGKEERVVAIGETGLDYHYDHSPREKQREAFEAQLALAAELELPAIVHSREATSDTMAILEASNCRKGVLHCFSGDMQMAERAMDLGFFISLAGPVTFKKSTALKEVAARIPDDFLLLETDAPYLAPEPYRGKPNEPLYVLYTAAEVARLRGITVGDVTRIVSLNAARLFGIGELPPEDTLVYQIRESLYLNVTNRCTNACSFCVRSYSDFVKGHNLRLSHEPSASELIEKIGDPGRYKEIVFCGYGEPTLRLEVLKEVAGWVKDHGGRVRLNTNGHGSLIHGRDILPELKGKIDSMSISLDAQDAETYRRLCRPSKPGAYEAMLEFSREAVKMGFEVELSVVGHEIVDVEACRRIAESIGAGFRLRPLNTVG